MRHVWMKLFHCGQATQMRRDLRRISWDKWLLEWCLALHLLLLRHQITIFIRAVHLPSNLYWRIIVFAWLILNFTLVFRRTPRPHNSTKWSILARINSWRSSVIGAALLCNNFTECIVWLSRVSSVYWSDIWIFLETILIEPRQYRIFSWWQLFSIVIASMGVNHAICITFHLVIDRLLFFVFKLVVAHAVDVALEAGSVIVRPIMWTNNLSIILINKWLIRDERVLIGWNWFETYGGASFISLKVCRLMITDPLCLTLLRIFFKFLLPQELELLQLVITLHCHFILLWQCSSRCWAKVWHTKLYFERWD